jgi:HEPN domain-containing protein
LDDAVFLKRYYIESRYPDDVPEEVRTEEVTEALTAASHLRDFVLAQVRVQ